MSTATRIAVSIACAALSACSAENNPVLGRVEAEVARHQVVVTNCYTMHLAEVQTIDGGSTQRFKPCKDAVMIKDDMLYVNGESFGQLANGDSVLVDRGKVQVVHR